MSRRIYLDADVVAAAALEPQTKEYIRDLRRSAIVRLCPAVVQEITDAPRGKRERLVRAAFEVCNCFTLCQAPEVLQHVYELPDDTALPSPPVLPIAELSILLGEDPPAIRYSWALRQPDKHLKGILPGISDLYKGIDRSTIGTFEHYVVKNAGDYLRLFGTTAVERGYLSDAPSDEETLRRLLDSRKPLFYVIMMTLANVYRAITQASLKGCLSDLRAVIESADGDLFLTRDVQLYECAKLVSETVDDLTRKVELLPRAA